MILERMKYAKAILTFLFILSFFTKAEEILDEKYYFQLYPSVDVDKSYLFHVYTPSSIFYTINSTEKENCKIMENKTVNEYPLVNLSSVIKVNNALLIKTCFGPDKIVEIINEKNETFFKKNIKKEDGTSGDLNNIKFCYSSSIYNPEVRNEYSHIGLNLAFQTIKRNILINVFYFIQTQKNLVK